jgi:hypothetical protein
MDGSYIFCNYKAILHEVFFIFNTFLPTFIETTYNCCKIPCLYFGAHYEDFVSICCYLQNCVHVVHLYRAQQVVVAECQIRAVRRMGKNSPSYFCRCLACAQVGVRPFIVVKEKDVFHVPIRTNFTDALSHFV